MQTNVKRSKTHQHPQLCLAGQLLEEGQSYQYLGATTPLVCLGRTIILALYSTTNLILQLCRPHLEYACTVWDPHFTKEIIVLKIVQRFACKICCKSWLMDYEIMLTNLFRLAVFSLKVYYFHIPPRTTTCEPFPIICQNKCLHNSFFHT